MKTIIPCFTSDFVPIVLSTDKNYLVYMSVTISSIIKNSDHKKNYDIIIFTDEISNDNERRIISQIKNKSNFSIRFFNINDYIDKIDLSIFKVREHFTIAAYYRFFIPKIMSEYKKVVYLDCDLVINKDIAELYKIELEDNYLGAVASLGSISSYHRGEFKHYFEDILKILDPNQYFNSGVMVFNIPKMIEDNIFDKLILKLKSIENPIYVDQDIFNAVCASAIKILDQSWNLTVHILKDSNINFLPIELRNSLNKATLNPFIIHYTSGKKPWNSQDVMYSDFFWQYAKLSPYYKEIRGKYINRIKKIDNVNKENKSKLEYYRLLFLSKILLGKSKKHYSLKLRRQKIN